jgi:dTDP-4-dehydrorhamnose reductase
MQKILITGANGLLGQKLVHLLLQQPDVQLVATGLGANRQSVKHGYEYMAMDITQEASVAEVMATTKPNVVIHTAAMTNVDQCESEKELCWLMNVDALRFLTKACTQHNSHLIHLSTDFIFDGAAGPYTELDSPSPISYYGESKLAAEQIVQAASCPWAIARTVLVYGIVNDMSRSNIILWVKKSLEDGKSINVVTDQYRSPTLAEDLAMGCWLIAQKGATGIYNISGADLLTPYDMAMATARFFGLDQSLIKQADSSTFSQPAKRPPRTGFVIDKARRELGYAPHSFEQGIALVAAQVAANV